MRVDAVEGGKDFGAEEAVGVADYADFHFRIPNLLYSCFVIKGRSFPGLKIETGGTHTLLSHVSKARHGAPTVSCYPTLATKTKTWCPEGAQMGHPKLIHSQTASEA